MKKHNTNEYRDDDGTLIYQIRLGKAGIEYAEIEAIEYHRLRQLGLSDHWSKGNNFVKAPCKLSPTKYVSVARAIVAAGSQEVIVYRDGNHYNLRRSNLSKKWSGRTDLKCDMAFIIENKNYR
jgi:hypothetical protein